MRTQNPIDTHWDGRAQEIDDDWAKREAGVREADAAVIGPLLTGAVLEVGCGTGMMCKALLPYLDGCEYTGIDNSADMLALARRRLPGLAWTRGNAESMQLPDGDVDTVISVHMIQHIPYYTRSMWEMVRVARKQVMVISWIRNEPENVNVDEVWTHMNIYNREKFILFCKRLPGVKNVSLLAKGRNAAIVRLEK